MFERRLYSEKPPRYEYVLTDKGRDFFPVIVAMLAWGNQHLAPEGKHVLLAERKTARPLEPVVVDAETKTRIHLANVMLVPGPRASAGMRKRLASISALRPASDSLRERS